MIEQIKRELINLFGDRVAFHVLERKLYSTDVAVLPGLVKKQIVTLPDAVVQPNTREELTALVNIGRQYKVPLVPRGAGTAGYGGAVPTKGGIVVDLSRLNKIISIDKGKRTAVVEAGVVWNELDVTLRAEGLALRLYPGSTMSATVGGWIANGGGIGIGSYEYGYLKDNILELEIITPNGAEQIGQNKLDLVEGMAGTVGFISRATLMLRDYKNHVLVLAAFPTIENMTSFFKELTVRKLELWEVGYKDPSHVRLTSEAVQKQTSKGPIHRNVKYTSLPQDKFLVMSAYPQSRDDKIGSELVDMIKAQGGKVLDEKLAQSEWKERFYGIRFKALGPSLIPSEVIIPTEKLPALVKETKKKVKQLAFNGTLVNSGKEAAFLGYGLDDERRRGFALAYSASFVPIKAAIKLGGRPYTAGMVLANKAELSLGKDRVVRAFEFKQKVDSDHIMNPGKVFPSALDKDSRGRRFDLMIKLAELMPTGLMRGVDKLFGGKPLGKVVGTNTILGKLPFGKEVIWDAFACTSCGYCRNECTEFNAIGWESSSPRGKFHFIREYVNGNVQLDERMAEMFFTCSTCRKCNEVCQIMTPIDEHWGLTLKPAIWQAGFNPPSIFQTQAHNILTHGNSGGIPQSERKVWMPPDLKYEEEGETGYWVGCSSSFSAATRNLAVNTIRILNEVGIKPTYLGSDEWCCGGALFTIGCLDEVLDLVEKNISELHKRGVKTLVTTCSGCWLNISHLYPVLAKRLNLDFDIEVKHVTQVISELIEDGRIKCSSPIGLKVTYHDPCHIGRGGGIYEPPRKILSSIPKLELIEMPRNRENSACCGSKLMRYPRLGTVINTSRLIEAKQTGASVVVGACPTCETNLRSGIKDLGLELEVFDITDLVAESMGLPTLIVGKLMKLGA